ncbi:MAG: ComEC/Rec2 family competence protein, partial [Candidatus Uhrbacteria bacterium]
RTTDRLTLAGTCAVAIASDVRIIGRDAGSPTIAALLAFHRLMVERLDRSLAEPAAGLVAGILLGVRRALPDDVVEAFRRTGTIHILVVSGFHMSFIGLRIRDALLHSGFIPRRLALMISLALVAAFLVMVGLQSSALRGALMVAAIIAVGLLGRLANPVRVLLLVATAMVLTQPHVLAFDLGFQLSFAATAGLLLIAPIVRAWLGRRPSWWWLDELRDLLSASVAAALVTAPLLLGAFGTLAPLTPFTNIIVLPFIPFFMGIGTILLVVALVVPFAVAPFAWAVEALSGAIVAIVGRAAALPGAQLTLGAPHAWFIVGCYVILAIAAFWWYRRRGVHVLSPFAFDPAPLLRPKVVRG